jgi:hypothetical protein
MCLLNVGSFSSSHGPSATLLTIRFHAIQHTIAVNVVAISSSVNCHNARIILSSRGVLSITLDIKYKSFETKRE